MSYPCVLHGRKSEHRHTDAGPRTSVSTLHPDHTGTTLPSRGRLSGTATLRTSLAHPQLRAAVAQRAHLGLEQFTVPTGHKIDSPICVVLLRRTDPQSKEFHRLLSTENPRNHSSREIRFGTPNSFLRFISRHSKYLY